MSHVVSQKHWLLLRGLVRERRHWADFPEKLSERTGGRVLTLDLPGVGTERGRAAPTSIPATVRDLRARFLAQRDPGEWRIFGPSLGGMVVLSWAQQYPEDFVEAVVSNTSAREVAGPFQRLLPEALRTIFLALLTRDLLARERRLLGLTSNTERGRAQAETYAQIAREAPVSRSVLFRQLLAASRATAPSSLPIPLLVLCSEGDRLCSPQASRKLAARLGARLAIHPDAGHELPLDAPDWVLDQLERGARAL